MPGHSTQTKQFTAIIEREGDGFVALCPELDVASQGNTIEEARQNLQKAVELFLETADPSEIAGAGVVTRASSLPSGAAPCSPSRSPWCDG